MGPKVARIALRMVPRLLASRAPWGPWASHICKHYVLVVLLGSIFGLVGHLINALDALTLLSDRRHGQRVTKTPADFKPDRQPT